MLIFEVISLPLPLQEFVYVPSIPPATTLSKNEVMMTRDPDEKCVVDFRTMTEINFKTGSLSCPPYFLFIFVSRKCSCLCIFRAPLSDTPDPHLPMTFVWYASEKVDLSFVVHQLQKTGG